LIPCSKFLEAKSGTMFACWFNSSRVRGWDAFGVASGVSPHFATAHGSETAASRSVNDTSYIRPPWPIASDTPRNSTNVTNRDHNITSAIVPSKVLPTCAGVPFPEQGLAGDPCHAAPPGDYDVDHLPESHHARERRTACPDWALWYVPSRDPVGVISMQSTLRAMRFVRGSLLITYRCSGTDAGARGYQRNATSIQILKILSCRSHIQGYARCPTCPSGKRSLVA
jgi:hypothetical protein